MTSSYLEGTENALAAYGYNRDRKRGKKRIVIGLLCGDAGAPVSVEVFEGNTQDLSTFASQVRKVAGRFGCREVTFVGDRGMIKSAQVERLIEKKNLSYLIVRELRKAWAALDMTVEEGLDELGALSAMRVGLANKARAYSIPRPNPSQERLLRAAQVRLPEALPHLGAHVVTRRKLPSRRTNP